MNIEHHLEIQAHSIVYVWAHRSGIYEKLQNNDINTSWDQLIFNALPECEYSQIHFKLTASKRLTAT